MKIMPALKVGDCIMTPGGRYREVTAVNPVGIGAVRVALRVPGSAWGYDILMPEESVIRVLNKR